MQACCLDLQLAQCEAQAKEILGHLLLQLPLLAEESLGLSCNFQMQALTALLCILLLVCWC